MNPTEIQKQNSPLYSPAGGVGTTDRGFIFTGENPELGGWEKQSIASQSAANSMAARNKITNITQDVNNTELLANQNSPEPDKGSREGVQQSLVDLVDNQEQAYNDYVDALDRWSGKAIKFSREEQKVLDDVKARYKNITNRQIVANQSLETGFATSQFVSGLTRYGAEVAALEAYQVANAGIDRLREIDLQAEEELRKTREAIVQGHIDGITASYEAYSSTLKARRDTLAELRLNLNAIDTAANNATTSDMKEYQFAKENGYTGSFLDFMRSVAQAKHIESSKKEDDDPYAFLGGDINIGGSGDTPLVKSIKDSFTRNQLSRLAIGLGVVKENNFRGQKFDEKKFYDNLDKIVAPYRADGYTEEQIVDALKELLQ